MRVLAIAAVLMLTIAAHGQVLNGDFEKSKEASQAPHETWKLKGNLLPETWSFNTQSGGTVGLVEQAHSGKYALSLHNEKGWAHVVQGMIPVKPGDTFELSGWAREGRIALTFYEYAAGNRWLRTVPSVVQFAAGEQWVEGGGYHTVTDPEVVALTVVIAADNGTGALIDDVTLRPVQLASASGANFILENDNCRLTLDAGGKCTSLYDKTLKEELLAGLPRPFMRGKVGGWTLPVTGLEKRGSNLIATFGDQKAKATFECQIKPYWFGLILRSSEPKLDGVTLVDINVKRLDKVGGVIGGTYDARSALLAQALHYSGVGTARSAPDQSVNIACGFNSFGTARAGCALLSCPRPRLIQTIQEVEVAYGLPSPRLDGQWGKQSALMQRSYFFVTDLSEANVDEVIRYAKRGHFGYILILEHAWSNAGGTFAINERNFPHGLAGFKATVAKLQRAGFKVGLHILSAGMSRYDPLVTPVPDDGIYVDSQVPLAADLDDKADFIPTTAPPSKFDLDSSYEGSGMFVRLGDEIVSYGGLSLESPYGLTRCQRGALGTKAAAHKSGDAVRHLMMSYGLFLIDVDSNLMERVAANVARTVNACGIDGLYFDGAERLQGDHNYYNGKIMETFYKAFRRKDMLMQGSSFNHHSWHLVSREASADGFARIKEYLDKRTPSFQWYFDNLMPLDIGWYAINANIRPDDIEYVCSRAVGFSSSISIETGIANLNSVPQAPEIIDMIARWEDLRLSGRVDESLREKLRQPGQDYHLERQGNRDVLVPAEYSAWADTPDPAGATGVLKVENKREALARVELQVECGETLRPGDAYEAGQALELFEAEPAQADNQALGTNQFNPSLHGNRATRAGVTQELTLLTDDVKEGKSAVRFTAVSTLKDNGGWATFGKDFPAPFALQDYHYLGIWVKGDGKGELLKVQLWDAAGKPQDQYIRVDFTGWRFLELKRPDPDVLDTTQITRIQFYYNAIPAETTVSTILDGVKVLSRPTRLSNPSMLIGGRRLTFPVTMNTGDRLLYGGPENCWLYPVGQEKQAVRPQGDVGELKAPVEVSPEPATHRLTVRAAMFWPSLALPVPAK